MCRSWYLAVIESHGLGAHFGQCDKRRASIHFLTLCGHICRQTGVRIIVTALKTKHSAPQQAPTPRLGDIFVSSTVHTTKRSLPSVVLSITIKLGVENHMQRIAKTCKKQSACLRVCAYFASASLVRLIRLVKFGQIHVLVGERPRLTE